MLGCGGADFVCLFRTFPMKPTLLNSLHALLVGGAMACLLSACSSDDDDSDDGSNSPSGGGVCFTANLTNTVAGEKTNASV